MDIIILIAVLLVVMAVNYPIIDYISEIRKNKTCKCVKSWKVEYLYYYILFWYANTSLQIILLFITPKLVNWFSKSIFYYPSVVISGVSYTFYIMILWSYVDYLKQSNCNCSEIDDHQYVLTYSWFFFLLYVVSVSYLGVTISQIGK